MARNRSIACTVTPSTSSAWCCSPTARMQPWQWAGSWIGNSSWWHHSTNVCQVCPKSFIHRNVFNLYKYPYPITVSTWLVGKPREGKTKKHISYWTSQKWQGQLRAQQCSLELSWLICALRCVKKHPDSPRASVRSLVANNYLLMPPLYSVFRYQQDDHSQQALHNCSYLPPHLLQTVSSFVYFGF